MTFTTGACPEAPPATANETLPTNETLPADPQTSNESLPVDVPDHTFTAIPDRAPGCGCSVQTCCDAIAASGADADLASRGVSNEITQITESSPQAGYLGCAPVYATRGAICDQVTAGTLDGSLSVCDVPEFA